MAMVAFHFDYRSPYSYLALTQMGDLAMTFHPFDVLDVMKRVGNSPTTIICKAKGEYAGKDLARWARKYGVPLSRNPKMRELDGRRLARATLAIPEGPDRRKAVEAMFKAMWVDHPPLDTAADIAALFTSAGVALPADCAAKIDSDAMEAALDAENAASAERGVFGSPSFFVGDEMFFGNDRLDFLRDALAATEQVAA